MNSALKPVLPQPGVVQPGGQASPAKGNVAVAGGNHAAHPQAAQASLLPALVGQNLIHHVPAPPPLPHAVPSMAPVSANMAQMAQNMSHHGNLSHVTQNSVAPILNPSPNKGNPSAPLSLVHQDKALALTRTTEKNEADSTGSTNGTIDSPKSGSNEPVTLKPQNIEANKEKLDIAKTSPSTPKPPEKPCSSSNTPQKGESYSVPIVDSQAQFKVITVNEAAEKTVPKPIEIKPAPQADIAPAPSQSDNKISELKEASTPVKQDAPEAESAKIETAVKPEDKIEQPRTEKPIMIDDKNDSKEVKEDKPDPPKKEEMPEKLEKIEEKSEEKKIESKVVKVEQTKPKSTLKLATVTPPIRKRRQVSPSISVESTGSVKKLADTESTSDTRIKRNRTKVQLYQCPTPELTMATKLSASAGRSTPTKANDDKLIVFYKNEYLAVRNAEGGFYVCQTTQNVYRTTRKIKIRWLSQDKTADASGETYKPDFYDVTDMECVLTTLSMSRAPGGGGAQLLKSAEAARARSILERALHAEQGGAKNIPLTEEHPDGLDLSLYKDESQLEKKSRKRNSTKLSPQANADNSTNDIADLTTPVKKSRTTPKRSLKSARKSKTPQSKTQSVKRKSPGSTPTVASTSKTATAVTEKAKAKVTPVKKTHAKPTKPDTPAPSPMRKARRSGKDLKPSPIVPIPSTSTGKTTRTPRKPPAKK